VALPIQKQIEEANAGGEVSLLSSHTFKNLNGNIVTEYFFKPENVYNISSDELNNGSIKIQLPGGTFEGITTQVEGAPEFEIGKKVFLLFKKEHNNIYLSNFTLGKYNIQKYNNEDYYVSEVFPLHPNVGRIKKDSMIKMLKESWKLSNVENRKENISEKIVINNSTHQEKKVNFAKRQPSSKDEEEGLDVWKLIVMSFSLIGIVFCVIQLRKKSDHE
jgi:hypothetical protein